MVTFRPTHGAVDDARLRAALVGRDEEIPVSAVFSLLPAADLSSSERVELCHDAMADPRLPTLVRVQAAAALAVAEGVSAVPALAPLVDSADDELAADVATLLARLAGADQAARIERAHRRVATPWHRQRTAAALGLLTHRTGIGEGVSAPDGAVLAAPSTGAPTVLTAPPEGHVRREALDAARSQLPADVGDDPPACLLTCPGQVAVLVLTAAAVEPGRLARGPALAAVLVAAPPAAEEYDVVEHVLTRPAAAGELAVVVTRPAGTAVMVGRGRAGTLAADAEVTTLDAPGIVPTTIRASLAAGRLHVTGRRDRRKRPSQPPTRGAG